MNHAFPLFTRFKYPVLITVLSAIVLAGSVTPPLFAQTPTTQPDSASETSSPTTESLRERIEKIVEEQKDKVQSVLQEFSNERRAFIGQVTRVSETTLTVQSRDVTRIVPLEGVTLMRGNTTLTPQAVEVDSWALVLGVAQGDSFIPKKVMLSPTSLRPDTHVAYLGSIASIKARSLDFQPRGQETILTVTLNNTTQYQNDQGETVRLADFIEDDQVLLVGYQENETIIVTTIRALAPLSRNN